MSATMRITSNRDLLHWVSEHTDAYTSDADHERIVAAIIDRPGRPLYGEAWADFLATLPDNLHELIAEPSDPAMFQALAGAGLDFSVGSRSPEAIERVIGEWAEAGFTPAQASEWLEAGCFSADAAESLRDAGMTPARAGRQYRGGTSIGYAVANNDLCAEDAASL